MPTRTVTADQIADVVRELTVSANINLRPDVLAAIEAAIVAESSESAEHLLGQLVENARHAAAEGLPLCQDCGYTAVFVVLGQDVRLEGDLRSAVDEGVRRAHKEGHLRTSVVAEPCFERPNTGDNTPVSLHVELVPGDALEITVMPKGAGSDNKSRLLMLKPADGMDIVKEFVVQVTEAAGADACPPFVVGVGIGGSFDTVGALAKKALLRPVGSANPDERLAEVERELMGRINALGIGPGGLGGDTTALGVAIETAACHMASLPVAVDLSCHSLRSSTTTL